MEIRYDGTEKSILKIVHALPGETKAIRTEGKSIIIPTNKGAKQVYTGDTVVIDGDDVSVIEK